MRFSRIQTAVSSAAAGAAALALLNIAGCGKFTPLANEPGVVVSNHDAANQAAAAEEPAVRPFRVDVPDEALFDLRRRIAATRWPDLRAAFKTLRQPKPAPQQASNP
jgi:hypothetical protein